MGSKQNSIQNIKAYILLRFHALYRNNAIIHALINKFITRPNKTSCIVLLYFYKIYSCNQVKIHISMPTL